MRLLHLFTIFPVTYYVDYEMCAAVICSYEDYYILKLWYPWM
jgi:hypothetical protein